ncbi:thioredoxin fold domain-containing protein [Candidatus Poribacteria bacterium]|nr:thioredoxin fold domain-containing protein [Candidatus Poribacteria bacterium]
MRPVVAAVALEYRDVFSFVKLDVRTQPDKTTEYNIRGTPTYIVFRDGEMVEGFVGAMPKAELVKRILGILEIEETEEKK